MRFAIFDQMERLDTPLHQVYQDRPALDAGFRRLCCGVMGWCG